MSDEVVVALIHSVTFIIISVVGAVFLYFVQKDMK